ncbi:MAG: DUF805 domain-containing protein [Sphingopyxis sp.]
MANITASIRHCLSNLTNFTGRDRPGQYWPYTIFLILLQMVVGLAFTLPLIINSMRAGFDAARTAAASGGQVDQAQLQAQMMHETMAVTQDIMPYTIGLGVLIALLLVAATVRRLHDRDWSGWWVLLAVAGKVLGIVSGYWTMDIMAADPNAIMNHMGTLSLLGWLPWVAYIILLVQLVQSGEPSDNRFGPPPAA